MWWILVVTLKATAVLAVSGCLAVLLRNASAATRHLVWSVGIVAALMVPALSLIVPHWSAPLGTALVQAKDYAAQRLVTPPTSTIEQPFEASVSPPMIPVGQDLSEVVANVPNAASETMGPGPATRTSQASVVSPAGISIGTAFLILWAMGAGVFLSIVLVSLGRIAQLERSTTPLDDRRVLQIAEGLVAHLGIARRVRFVENATASMPMTWGAFNPAVMLPASAREWDLSCLHDVLIHELSHVKRWDYLTQLIARGACAVYWFNPIMWLAARALRVERERACDDAVLNSGSKASDYAHHLLEIARSLRTASLTTIASVAMAKPSQLSGRLLAVLDGTRRRRSVTYRTVFGAGVASLILAGTVAGATAVAADVGRMDPVEPEIALDLASPRGIAPDYRAGNPGSRSVSSETMTIPISFTGLLQGCDWNAQTGRRSTSTDINDDRIRIRIEIGECELNVDADGEITFSDDERDVVAISGNGYLEIEEKVGRVERVLKIDADGGRLTREWSVDGESRPYGADAEEWLATMLPTLFRLTGLHAEERATRIYEQGGADALLQEIALIPSDHTARRYFSVLLAQGDLDGATLRQVVQQAGEQISSDYELAELLIYVAENQPLDENLQIVYVEASNNLSSDHEHRRALSAVLQRGNISQDLAETMLLSAQEIESDWEVAELLLELLERHPINDALTPAFFEVVANIDSDHERGRVIKAALAKGAPSAQILDGALAMATDISSDWEMAELLLYIADLYPMQRALPASYLEAARSLDSDHELNRVLRTLLDRDQLSETALLDVLDVSTEINGDFERTELLRTVAARYAISGQVQQAYFEALGYVDSDWSRGEILKALLEQDLTSELVNAIIESAMTISSDFELAELLVDVAGRYGVSDDIRDGFMRAADQIDSAHDRGRVLDVAYPRR